jgi:hypothetical protein
VLTTVSVTRAMLLVGSLAWVVPSGVDDMEGECCSPLLDVGDEKAFRRNIRMTARVTAPDKSVTDGPA